MSAPAQAPASPASRSDFPAPTTLPSAKLKASATWQDALWRRWPREDCWPVKMDVYEAAAYLRVSPDTIRRAVVIARDGRAKLAHQRLGSVYRFRKADLDAFGAVPGRNREAVKVASPRTELSYYKTLCNVLSCRTKA